MTTKQKSSRSSGMFPTLTVAVLLIATVFFLFFHKEKAPPTAEEMRQNELRAYEHMQQLITAQAEYIKHDYDKNFIIEYALFIPHLWRSIGEKNEKIQVSLLPKTTAFAIEKTRAVDGYYFIQKFTKPDPENPESRIDIDTSNEWGAMMAPAEAANGLVMFFADQSGRIYVRRALENLDFPVDPASDSEWILLKDVEQLKELQRQLHDQPPKKD